MSTEDSNPFLDDTGDLDGKNPFDDDGLDDTDNLNVDDSFGDPRPSHPTLQV